MDGKALSNNQYTDDMDEHGGILVKEPRKYDIINLKGDDGRYTLTLQVPEGISAYAFTFGDEKK